VTSGLDSVALALGAVLAASSPALAQTDSARAGEYVWGAEVNVFRPCGSDSVFWVLASPQILDQLRTTHGRLTTKPYEPIYVRVRGARSSEKPDGFAEDYNGYFRITEVLEARRERPGECRR
jgi:NlpE C-terminal OB domain